MIYVFLSAYSVCFMVCLTHLSISDARSLSLQSSIESISNFIPPQLSRDDTAYEESDLCELLASYYYNVAL